jgi:single-stranded-DNA-specific exonuclease
MNWKHTALPETPAIKDLRIQLSQKGPFPEVLVNLLAQRGLDTLDKVKTYFQPDGSLLHDPFGLRDMDKAVDRILQAIQAGEAILLYGDYDVDGTTSVALMKCFFSDWGIELDYYIPDRFQEGYGISLQGIDVAAQKGVQLLIALDCGTKAVDKIRYAREKGIDVIVVDHHTVGEELPPAVAMINPRHPDCAYPFKELPACGLAMKLAQALASRLPALGTHVRPPADPDVLARYCDLLALSIACDIVPLVGENRVLIAKGLQKLKTKPLPGIAALMQLSATDRPWEVEDLVFFLGPRINSAGRLYTARDSVDLLLGKGPNLHQFAADLNDYNVERKQLEEVIHKEALAMVVAPEEAARASTVLWHPDWNKGVVGIVASRLIERHYRPTILLTESNGYWVGSGRSVEGFDLYAAIEAASEHLLQFGGHKYAAGLTMSAEQRVPFKEAFDAYVEAHLLPAQRLPTLELAGRLDFQQLTDRFIRQMRLFGPFGPENPEPVFYTEPVEVKDARILKENHLRLMLQQGALAFEAIGFNLSWKWREPSPKLLRIAFQPDIKTWKGRVSIQLKLKDFEAL